MIFIYDTVNIYNWHTRTVTRQHGCQLQTHIQSYWRIQFNYYLESGTKLVKLISEEAEKKEDSAHYSVIVSKHRFFVQEPYLFKVLTLLMRKRSLHVENWPRFPYTMHTVCAVILLRWRLSPLIFPQCISPTCMQMRQMWKGNTNYHDHNANMGNILFSSFFLIQVIRWPTQLTMPLSHILLIVLMVLLHCWKWNEAVEWLQIQADRPIFDASSATYLLYELEDGLWLWTKTLLKLGGVCVWNGFNEIAVRMERESTFKCQCLTCHRNLSSGKYVNYTSSTFQMLHQPHPHATSSVLCHFIRGHSKSPQRTTLKVSLSSHFAVFHNDKTLQFDHSGIGSGTAKVS